MKPSSVNVCQIMLAVLAVAPGVCRAAAGDLSFRAIDRTVHFNPSELSTTIDVVVEVEGGMSLPTTGWGMIVDIVPQLNSSGHVHFDPPPIVNAEPNLAPASQNAFLDFDRDFGGMSYGMLGADATQLRAFAHYIAPTLSPPPMLDAHGNLTVPDGAGLVSLPLVMTSDAAGEFLVVFDPDPVVTGMVFATGTPVPNDVGIHPIGSHVAAVFSVINPAGDYNRNRVVDAADYTVWRDALGQTGEGLAADGNADAHIDLGDYTLWRSQFGQTTDMGLGTHSETSLRIGPAVPEPASAAVLLAASLAALVNRKIRRRRARPTR